MSIPAQGAARCSLGEETRCIAPRLADGQAGEREASKGGNMLGELLKKKMTEVEEEMGCRVSGIALAVAHDPEEVKEGEKKGPVVDLKAFKGMAVVTNVNFDSVQELVDFVKAVVVLNLKGRNDE